MVSVMPQGAALPKTSPAVVVSGALRRGALALTALGLGEGGTRGASLTLPRQPGTWLSPRGILVRARREGVKLDFPSRAELLITPGARVHLRTGERTLPHLHGLTLLFTDGASLRIWRSPSGRRPLERVDATDGTRNLVLWRHLRATREAAYREHATGTTLLVLGDGRVLYRALPLGPLILLERILCPHTLAATYPPYRLVVVGDVLAESLRRLPALIPRRTVEFPQARQAALNLRHIARQLFRARMIMRPPGAVGSLIFPLPGDFRLLIQEQGSGPVTIGLLRESSAVPVVEWTIGPPTRLHLVRPMGGAHGGPRYFLRGIPLDDLLQPLLPMLTTPHQAKRAREILRALSS